jgi:biotin carboxyl carrier protein
MEGFLKTGSDARSDEIEEIIDYRPHWTVRRGPAIILAILLLLILLSCFIGYPDRITAPIRLVSSISPVHVQSNSAGFIEKLFIKNEETVKQGDILAFIRSNANHQEVIKLRDWLNQIDYADTSKLREILLSPLPLVSNLGELQDTYEGFKKTFLESTQILSEGYYQSKKRGLKKDLEYLSNLKNNIVRQKELLDKDYELQKVEYSAKESLMKDKVIAPLEFNQEKSRLITKQHALEESNSTILNAEMMKQKKQTELLDLEKVMVDQKNIFHSSLFTLKSAMQTWMDKFIIIAPIGGKVLYKSPIEEKQLVTSNQELFYIESYTGTYYAIMMAPQVGLGKLENGQRVILKLESFPSEDFGHLEGRISYISRTPQGDSFLIRITLQNGLITNLKRPIIFRNDLIGKGEVITSNKTVFHRIIRGFTGLGD